MNLRGRGQKIVVRNVEYEGGLLHIYFLQREQTGYAGSSQIACEIIQSCWTIRGVLVLKSMGYRVENGWFDVAKPGVDGPGVDAFRNIGCFGVIVIKSALPLGLFILGVNGTYDLGTEHGGQKEYQNGNHSFKSNEQRVLVLLGLTENRTFKKRMLHTVVSRM